MAISFTCVHCQKSIRVTDKQAGKKGPCPYCRKAIVVPMQSTQSAAKAKVGSAELEALAIDVVAEKPAEQQEENFVDHTCPYCDETIKVGASLAGKNAPCPSCKRVIKMPQLVKTGPRDWRKPEAPSVPSGAKQAQPAADSWGAQPAAAKVSRQALVAAKVIKEERERWTVGQWVTRGSAAAVVLLVIIGGVFWYLGFRQGKLEDNAFALAKKTAAETQKKKPWPAELQTQYQTYLSLFYHRSGKTDENGRGATVHLQLARQEAERISDPIERLGALRELLRAMIDVNSEAEDIGAVLNLVMQGPREHLLRTMSRQWLGGAQTPEAQAATIAKLKQIVQRAIPAQAVAAPASPDKDKPNSDAVGIDYSEQVACLADIGIELIHLGQADKARELADAAAALAKNTKVVPIPMLTLLLLIGKPLPGEGIDANLVEAAQVLAAARKRDLTKAQNILDQGLQGAVFVRLQAVLEAADAFIEEDQKPEAVKWLLNANQLLKNLGWDETVWQRMWLLELMGAASFPEAEQLIPNLLPANSSAAQRTRFEIFRWKAKYSSGNLDPDQIKTMAPSPGSAAAAAFVYGRHLAKLNQNEALQWAEKVEPEPLRAFAALGTALTVAEQRK
jgi:hypothetical protein